MIRLLLSLCFGTSLLGEGGDPTAVARVGQVESGASHGARTSESVQGRAGMGLEPVPRAPGPSWNTLSIKVIKDYNAFETTTKGNL